jgi:hypothetical protein
MVLFSTNLSGGLFTINRPTNRLYGGYRIASVIDGKPCDNWGFRRFHYAHPSTGDASQVFVTLPVYVNTVSTS